MLPFSERDSRKQTYLLQLGKTVHTTAEAFCLKVRTKYIQVVRQSLIIDFPGNERIELGKHNSWNEEFLAFRAELYK